MKTIFTWLGVAMLLSSIELPAQAIFQSYYQWSNILNVDHGPYKKVKTWMDGSTAKYFAVGGANNPAGTNPMATFSLIDGSTGTQIYTKIISSPYTDAQTFEAVSLAISNNAAAPTIAVLCNYVKTNGKTAVLLYQFASNGLLTRTIDLGEGKGVDVIYNPASGAPAFDVLCEVNTSTHAGIDYEITSVDDIYFTVYWSQTYNWGTQDHPAALVIHGGDIVAAGYTEAGTDRQIFMVRVSAFGYLMWAQAFGLPNRRETITDVVYYLNTDSQFRYGFCGFDQSTGNGLVGDVSVIGPTYGYTERYITGVNAGGEKIIPSAIARNETNIYVCGSVDGDTPFIAMFSKNANITPLNISLYDDGEDIKEALLDIHYEFGQPNVVSVGYERRSVAWGTSPANQDYSWIMNIGVNGRANCRTAATQTTVLYNATEEYGQATENLGDGATEITGYANPTFYVSLDNCVTPARLAGPGSEEPEGTNLSALYPNPGDGIFYLDGAIDESKTALLRITDMTGRLICEKQLVAGTTKQTIDLSDLPDGAYAWSVIINGESIRSEKLIIVR